MNDPQRPVPFPPFLDVLRHANDRIRRVVCRECIQVLVDDLPTGSTENERLAACKGVAAHVELFHDMVSFYGRCPNRACEEVHLAMFREQDLTPRQWQELKRIKNVR